MRPGVYLCGKIMIFRKLKTDIDMVRIEKMEYVAPGLILGQLQVQCNTLLCGSKEPITPYVGTEDYDDGDNYNDSLFD